MIFMLLSPFADLLLLGPSDPDISLRHKPIVMTQSKCHHDNYPNWADFRFAQGNSATVKVDSSTAKKAKLLQGTPTVTTA